MRTFEKAFKLPLIADDYGTFIFDAYNNIVAEFVNDDIKDIDKDLYMDVINGVNANSDFNFTQKDGDMVYKNGSAFIMMRGWGYLTGRGALAMDEDKAIAIQEDLADYIVDRLNS